MVSGALADESRNEYRSRAPGPLPVTANAVRQGPAHGQEELAL